MKWYLDSRISEEVKRLCERVTTFSYTYLRVLLHFPSPNEVPTCAPREAAIGKINKQIFLTDSPSSEANIR
jgi:hypothetical protein